MPWLYANAHLKKGERAVPIEEFMPSRRRRPPTGKEIIDKFRAYQRAREARGKNQ